MKKSKENIKEIIGHEILNITTILQCLEPITTSTEQVSEKLKEGFEKHGDNVVVRQNWM